MSEENIKLGLCWYQPEQWERLKEIADDRDGLEHTYEEWRKNASRAISDFQANGQSIKKVRINLEELLLWCNEKGIAVNSEARSGYVAFIMQQQDKKP
jgi:hypothetical protein